MKPDKDRKNKRRKTACAEGSEESATGHKQAEEPYKTLAENSLAAVFIVQDGKFLFINMSAITNAGYSSDEIIGQYSHIIVHSDDREMVKRRGREMLQGGDVTPYEYRIVTKQGQIKWIMQIVSPIQFNGKKAILGNAVDITERKQAEKALQESEALYRVLAEKSFAGFYVVQNGKFRFINFNAASYAAYTREELLNHKALELVHPEDREKAKKNAAAMLRGELISPYEFRIITKQGQTRWIMETVTSINYEGKPAILGNSMDITELTETGIKLEEHKALQASILESIPQAVLGLHNRIIIFSNADVEKIFGWKTEELIGKSIRILYRTDEEYERLGNLFYEFLERQKIYNEGMEFFYRHKDGRDILCRVRISRIGESLGAESVVATFEDITNLRQAEESLRAANQRLEDIIEFLPDATFVIDKDKKVIAWNRAIEEMTGLLKQDIIGKGDFTYAVPFYGIPRPILIDLVEITDEEMKEKYTYLMKRGNTIYGEAFVPALRGGKGAHLWGMASPLFDVRGNLCGAIESIRDVTEQRQTEDQLKYLSNHDKLTGLYNRSFFDTEMARHEHGRQFPVSIIVADVDGLKSVNDNYGHAEGDKLLQSAARVLKKSLRRDDILARIGGDEFAVLQPETDQRKAALIIERIYRNLDKCDRKSDKFFLSISLGSATAQEGDSLTSVMKIADEVMYGEKFLKKQLKI